MNPTTPAFLPVGLIDVKLKADKQYWLHKLSGDLSRTSLPADFPAPAQPKATQILPFEFRSATGTKLREICGDNDLLIFTVLVSALKICLHKYTGQEDITVGTLAHERRSQAGTLNKVLALRDSVTPEMKVHEVMNTVKKTLADAYLHQKYPFTRILELLQIEHEGSQRNLFNVAIVLENISDTALLDSLPLELSLSFAATKGALQGTLRYDPALFSLYRVEVFSRHFTYVVNSIIHDPAQSVSQVRVHSPEDEKILVEDFNKTSFNIPSAMTVHRIFEQQVERAPEKTALQCGSITWTYNQLNRRSNQLARYLQSRGVSSGTHVGILMDRSPEMFSAVLGILKAGGTYVPLEPQTAPAQLSLVLEDAAIQFVVTQSQHVQKLPATVQALVLEPNAKLADTVAADNLEKSGTPGDVAYIIYTSGSTGRPKGVQITHRSLVNYVCWAAQEYFRNDELPSAFYSSLAFDLTVTSLFCPLITGNRIVIYPGDVEEMLGRIAADGIAFIKVTPSHLLLFNDRIELAGTLQRIVVGGEAFESSLALALRKVLGPYVEIFNEYGPTEATVGCIMHRLPLAPGMREQVPIGIPSANTQIYLLDQSLRPVAPNMVGEIYIGGDGLALGYLNLPELTAECFIENPFIPGARLYRTGDLGRWLPGPQVEYAGRKDDQVKFHGYRVELNEIRTHLNAFPGVKDSVVVIHRDNSGNKIMVGYYAAVQELPATEIRSFMKARLQEALVPGFFVRVAQLPLTRNGKINRHALPNLDEIRKTLKQNTDESAKTPTEEVLTNIWCQVMGLPSVGVHDDFFALGGHSLLAVQIMSRARKVLEVGLPLRSLFEARTVSQLASVIDDMRRDNTGLQMPPLVRREDSHRAPLSYPQQRIWFAQQLHPDSGVYNVYPSFRVHGALDVESLEKSINEIIRRHEVLRTNFVLEDTGPVQVVAPNLTIRFPVRDLSNPPERERKQQLNSIITEERERCFDLAHDALIRVTLVHIKTDEHILLLALHHIVADAWAMQIFYRELTTLYRAFVKGEAPQLPKLPVQYKDYARWQRKWLNGDLVEKELAYWREKLRNVPAHIDFYNSRNRPAVTANKGELVDVIIDKEISDQLRMLSRRENCTLFMTTMAVFQALIHCYSGSNDFVIGIDVANRIPAETEDIIGFFVNLLAIRTDLSGDPAFHELIGRVRATCLEAYSHQQLPFERIVEDLNPERQGDRIPLVQVNFGLLPAAPIKELNLEGLKLTPLGGHNATSVFEFNLYLLDSPDGLIGSLQYSSDLFERATVVRMVSSFQQIVRQVVTRPEVKLSALHSMVDDFERTQRASSAQALKKSRLRVLEAASRKGGAVQDLIEVAASPES